jgi:peroxiredoxin
MSELIDMLLPSVRLRSIVPHAEEVDLSSLAARCSLVVYFYADNGTHKDAIRACVFHDYRSEFAELNNLVVGISSQSPDAQMAWAARENIQYWMGSDSDFLFARQLGLATIQSDGVCVYEFLTLVVREGRIRNVFYPGEQSEVMRVLEWLVKDGLEKGI